MASFLLLGRNTGKFIRIEDQAAQAERYAGVEEDLNFFRDMPKQSLEIQSLLRNQV